MIVTALGAVLLGVCLVGALAVAISLGHQTQAIDAALLAQS
ncbi:hypothetical protein [Brevundimonas diminuta]|nr:hypothetical protein [Brevundimonas diminuta]